MGAFVIAGVERLADVFYGAGVALPEFEQEIAIQVAVPRDTFESVDYVDAIEMFGQRSCFRAGTFSSAGGAGLDGGLTPRARFEPAPDGGVEFAGIDWLWHVLIHAGCKGLCAVGGHGIRSHRDNGKPRELGSGCGWLWRPGNRPSPASECPSTRRRTIQW